MTNSKQDEYEKWIDMAAGMLAATVFYFLWNGLSDKYFYFVPELYRHIGFWDFIGVLMIVGYVRYVLTPKFKIKIEDK